VTPRKTWLIVSAALAAAVYALMWIGYTSNWKWLTTIDSSWLVAMHRYDVAHPGWVTAWNVFCTVLGPTVFRLVTLVVIIFSLTRRNLRVALFLVHPSDVLARWALGYAYFVACLLMVPPSRPVTVTDETPAALGTAR
jgi:hypothetical protein